MIDIDYVVWDFDGVLNQSTVDGRFLWSENIEADLGISFSSFDAFVFSETFKDVLTGRKDLLDHIGDWVLQSGTAVSPERILAYWLENDARVDQNMISIMDLVERGGAKNAIATNNEDHRCGYIENELGFRDRIVRMFSSGRMKCMKPDKAYFDHIVQSLGTRPERLLLVDDSLRNIESAEQCGWKVHHFSERDYRSLRQKLGLG